MNYRLAVGLAVLIACGWASGAGPTAYGRTSGSILTREELEKTLLAFTERIARLLVRADSSVEQASHLADKADKMAHNTHLSVAERGAIRPLVPLARAVYQRAQEVRSALEEIDREFGGEVEEGDWPLERPLLTKKLEPLRNKLYRLEDNPAERPRVQDYGIVEIEDRLSRLNDSLESLSGGGRAAPTAPRRIVPTAPPPPRE